MNLLAISYCLPPLLNPQSFQIGRLLYHLPPQYKIYAVTAEDSAFQKDIDLYPDLFDKFEDVILIDKSRSKLSGWFRLPGIYIRWHIRAFWKIIRAWKKKSSIES